MARSTLSRHDSTFPRTGLLAAILALATWTGCGETSRKITEPIDLAAGLRLEWSISDGRAYPFEFTLESDLYLRLGIEQKGLDVVVILIDPAGRALFEIDSPIGKYGWEHVEVVTPAAGPYRLEVRPFTEAAGGRFALEVFELREAGETDRLRAAAAIALAGADQSRRDKEFRRAAELFRQALSGLEPLRDWERLANAQWRLGEALVEIGDLRPALAPLEAAASLFQELGDGVGEARALVDLGGLWHRLGEPELAATAYRRSLALYRQAGVELGQGSVLNNLGRIAETAGHLSDALGLYEQALGTWRRLERRRLEASTLQNLGSLHALMGRDEEALDLLRQAVALLESEHEEQGMGSALVLLGWAHTLAERPERALERYAEALELARRLGDRSIEGAASDRRGTALRNLGRTEEAARSYSHALGIFRSTGNRRSEGHTLANLGWLELTAGDPREASRQLSGALEILVDVGDSNAEIYALVGLGRASRLVGDLESARRFLERAVAIVEENRFTAGSELSRSTYLAGRYDAVEELVTLFMEIHRREPEGGFDRRALETVDWARARTLLEGRAISGLESSEPSAGAGISADQIRSLLDGETLMLVYFLAEPESFVWTADRERIEVHRLPGRRGVEEQARRVAAVLPRSHEIAFEEQAWRSLRSLSRAILKPVSARLAGRRRLAILADGALHLTPFAALPDPTAPNPRPLLMDYEIAALPSAAFLHRQRLALADREPAPGAVAVIADPVFGTDDERLTGGTVVAGPTAETAWPRDLERAAESFDTSRLERLPFAAAEARAILALVPEVAHLAALGFDADRELVENGSAGEYRIVHFATHGLIHPVRPELTGIVLSLVDAAGRPRDGFLRVHEVAALELPAELVVLSACRTGLGREIRGEGFLGLPQAFFRAGARRVIVSAWNVSDRATAELMATFYRRLLEDGLPPAAALREAQLAMLAGEARRAPYFWAAFSLQGDWRNQGDWLQ